jgi:hypothetical protein
VQRKFAMETTGTRRTDPAFPLGYHRLDDAYFEGMSKREFFALTILHALTAANVPFEDVYQKARQAMLEADALIDVLNE